MAMTQRQRTLSMLAIVASIAAALGGYAWFGVFKRGQAEQKAKDEQNTLFSFKAGDVKEISVTAKGATTTIARDGASGWRITAPIQAPADALSVNALVDKLAGLKRLRGVEGGADLSEYGLAKPRITIEVTLAAGGKQKLEVGDDNPYDGTLFTKTSGGAGVDVCEGALKYPLDKGLFDLRDKNVFAFEDDAVTQLSVVGPKLSFSLSRKSGSDWSIVTPIQEKADAQRAEQILASLRNLRATRFSSEQASTEELSRFGLDKPAYTVEVTLGKDSVQKTLAIADQKEGGMEHVYVKRASDPWIAEVPSSIVKDLDLTVMDLRDKTVLAFDEKDATGLSFRVGTASFGVDRHRAKTDAGFAPDAWTLASGGQPAKKWKCSSLLSTLQNLKGSSIAAEQATAAQLSGWGLASPAKTVTILGAGGKTIAELDVGKEEGGKLYIKAAASPRVFQIESYRLSQIPATQADLAETPPATTAKK